MNKEENVTPSWDLSDLYVGITDPRITTVLEETKKRAAEFEAQYKGAIKETSSAEVVLAMIQEYESILQEAVKPEIYATLIFSVDSATSAHGAFLQKTKTAFLDAYRHLVFFELELLALSEVTLKALMSDPTLANYNHFFNKLLSGKPHRLLEKEEQILNDMSLTGAGALVRLYDEEEARLLFPVELDGKIEDWPQEKVLDLLYSPVRERRQAGAKALTKGLAGGLRLTTYIYNVLGQDKETRDRYTNFKTPEASRHLGEEVTQEIVDTMTGVVTENYDIVHDFYNFKKEVLGLDTLYDYDRYAPVSSEVGQTYSYEDARRIVLDAYAKFSPLFAETTEKFFENGWIDADPKVGKRGGAYCMFVTPDLHPYVFVNYMGNAKSVLTLAHELGHAVHAYLMRQQTLLNFDTPLVVAETASVFGEMIVFDSLRNTITDPKEKFGLYMSKIEEIFATVFRQQVMYKFEQDFHTTRRAQGELTGEALGEMWIKRQREMFGSSVTLTEDYKIWWSYIQHFFHTPFYVYAYVFGEMLVLSLYEQYQTMGNKQEFVDKYITMLMAGGSKSPTELVAPFGVDLTRKEFWQGGMEVIRALVQEAKELRS